MTSPPEPNESLASYIRRLRLLASLSQKNWQIAPEFIRPLAKVVAGVLWGLEKGDRSPVFCDHHV